MTDPIPITVSARVYYSGGIREFVGASESSILGELAKNSEFSVDTAQRDAWLAEIAVLRPALAGVDGTVFLEFVVPRIGSRLDAIVIIGSTIFAIEFKVGETTYRRDNINQVWDYALDLKNFHRGSHEAQIIPVLVATLADSSDATLAAPAPDGVYPPIRCNPDGLAKLIRDSSRPNQGTPLDAAKWAQSPYEPTPTILEAARTLYSQHSVEAIARHDAGARNLRLTSRRIEELIDEAREHSRKVIIFVTGVPGAGKTLVGLNVATKRREADQPTHAVFLSGNGPLVDVLREALTRDEMERLKHQGKRSRKGVVGQKVKAFIQNVHHFRDAGLLESAAPSDHVVIFDEAQRAWNLTKTADFMKRRKKRPGFTQSEPEFLISYLNRHHDWAVVICLVGGGQEIHSGEAGIGAWLDAVRTHFPDWYAYVSPDLTDTEYAAGRALQLLSGREHVVTDVSLHLAVSMRSFRAENVSRFVKAVLDEEVDKANRLLAEIAVRYPIAITRDLSRAKQWIRDHARGTERYGLVASSEAQRLKPHAIDVRVDIDPVHWFLNGRDDTRSSFYLEDAATQFQVQGLELDWVVVSWDADLRFGRSGWGHFAFRGNKWTNIRQDDRQHFLLNAYRVLLTRARQGMVIFVPRGDSGDPTRAAEYYDPTWSYLTRIGVPEI